MIELRFAPKQPRGGSRHRTHKSATLEVYRGINSFSLAFRQNDEDGYAYLSTECWEGTPEYETLLPMVVAFHKGGVADHFAALEREMLVHCLSLVTPDKLLAEWNRQYQEGYEDGTQRAKKDMRQALGLY